MITVRHWYGSESIPVPTEYTVSRMLLGLQRVMDLPPGVTVVVNEDVADPDHRLRDGDVVNLLRPPGQKGTGKAWTVQELARKFRVPPSEVESWIEMGLPVVPLTDGTVRITETAFDGFVERGMSPPAHCSQPATGVAHPPPVKLTPTERKLIAALGAQLLTGEEIAEQAGYDDCHGYLKGLLSSLVKRRVLGNRSPGYYLLQPSILSDGESETCGG